MKTKAYIVYLVSNDS